MRTQGLEIRGVNNNWAVFHNGRKVREITGGISTVEATAHNLERRLRPKVERACIRCRDRFMSEGPHHRMCGPCRVRP